MDDIARGAPTARPARSSTAQGAVRRRASPGAQRASARPAPEPEPEDEREDTPPRRSAAPMPVRGVPPPSTVSPGASPISEPGELISDIRQFVASLGAADRIAVVGLGLLVLSGLLPWKETAEDGDILGVLSSGLLAILAAVAALGAIVIRVRRLLPSLGSLAPSLAQVVASGFTVVWCLVFMSVAHDTTEVPSPLGNAVMMNSSPSFGIYLGLLSALVGTVGSVLGLLKTRSS